MSRFRDRTEAGEQLAVKLMHYAQHPAGLVLALPRGGVPVAAEIAKALALPLEVCLVRKLGLPEQPELAMGAIASDGIMVLNHQVIRRFGVSRQKLLQVASQERQELERRRQLYQADRPISPLRDHLVILVDDGIATSSTLRAAIAIISRQQPQRLIVAAPVAPPDTCALIQKRVQEVICLITPDPLDSIGRWYEDFSQTSDQEVCRLLAEATERFNERLAPKFED
jgi:putative phosphoribosyl transferase